ncbi:PEP-CTERM sorting domain-containing protein [Candidatus Accumulibacter phosphatis]|uniref:PEP-CTERM sorting domain-containing protein n=2 Tax=Candidatus Accumulibacter phosphatis TaxID=327160 RepID=A0ABX1TT58_9PROT|nr:PEP-CTERM sorting domain-containing protein [Candidatus Accumulibacter phosphatis]
MSYAASNSLPNSQDNSAALQSAVWEVINETTSSYGFTTGTFNATSSTGSTQAALTALDAIWANLGTQTVTHYVDQLHSETNQDFLVAAVPEPESYAMLLAGLGIVGAVARRRRSAEA